MRTRTVALLTLSLLGVSPAASQEKKEAKAWAEALATYQRCSASRDPLERRQSADALGDATSEKHDKMCWQLVSALLRQELAKEGQNGRTEEKISGEVLEACLRAFRKINNKDVLEEMLKVAKIKQENPRIRAYALWGIFDRGDLKELAELVEDKSPVVQIAAMDGLAERADASLTPLFLRLLSENRTWEVKWVALKGLEKGGDEKCIEPLIESLGRCRADEGRLKDQYIRILRKLLDVDLESDDPNAWKSAWTAKKAGTQMAPGTTISEPTQFYGLKTRSTRLVFLLDRTGSMAEVGSEPPRSPYKLPPEAAGNDREPPQERTSREECTRILKKWNATPARTRIDVAKKEIINTIYVLRPIVHFNVVWYESTPTPWRQELVPATWTNKLDAVQTADKIAPSGGTNIWDAVEIGFKMLEVALGKSAVNPILLDRKANYATATNGVDTMFLMTDGRPNTGRINTTDDILAELKKVNRLRKVTVHTICVGDELPGGATGDSPDPVFLKKMAEMNNGEFVHIKK
jgi:hypothetical protein